MRWGCRSQSKISSLYTVPATSFMSTYQCWNFEINDLHAVRRPLARSQPATHDRLFALRVGVDHKAPSDVVEVSVGHVYSLAPLLRVRFKIGLDHASARRSAGQVPTECNIS